MIFLPIGQEELESEEWPKTALFRMYEKNIQIFIFMAWQSPGTQLVKTIQLLVQCFVTRSRVE